MPVTYEYAGFRYIMTLDETCKAVSARPAEGQHPAARKEKHLRAAVELYNEEKSR